MAYEINFCETKEQLKHLAEVVTGKADGSPAGADIEESTLSYTGQVRRTIPEVERLALESFRLGAAKPQGNYAIGVTFDESNWTYTYNGQQWGLSDNFDLSTLPYQATEADPNNDSNLAVRGNASEAYVQDYVESVTNYQADNVDDIIAGKIIGWQSVDDTIVHEAGQVWVANGSWRVVSTPVATINDLEIIGPYVLEDFATFQDALTALQTTGGKLTSIGDAVINITSAHTCIGDGTKNIHVDLSNSSVNSNTTDLIPLLFDGFKNGLFENIDVDCNNNKNFGVRFKDIPNINVKRSVKVKNVQTTVADIIIGVSIVDCVSGYVSPTVEQINASPATLVGAVARGVFIQTINDLECNLIVSPYIDTINCTEDGDGVYAAHIVDDHAGHKGGIIYTGGVYKNCRKRNIKNSLPNGHIFANKGSNDSGEMYAFISNYGAGMDAHDNQFSCDFEVGQKVDISSDLIANQNPYANYYVHDNEFLSPDNTATSNNYMVNYQSSVQTFGSLDIHDNVDEGSGRALRMFNTNTGLELTAHHNTLRSTVATPWNCAGVTLDKLSIDHNHHKDVASAFLISLTGATIADDNVNVTHNTGEFGFGNYVADDAFRAQNIHSNGPSSIGSNRIEFRNGRKIRYSNNNEPTSGEYLVGDLLINLQAIPGGWLEKVDTTAGTAGSTAVFKISKTIEV